MITQEEYEQELETNGGTVFERMTGVAGEVSAHKPLPNFLLSTGGKALFAYLQPSIGSICKNVYPDNPDAVDERLTANIFRDSNDPGALGVLTAGASLPPPRTKNELFEEYGGPVLVTQGVNDPLGGGTAKTRFGLYETVLPDDIVTAVALEAGHCPMHEAPAEVNSAIRDWLKKH